MSTAQKSRTRTAPRAKTRKAEHHRKTKNYLKTYWPYIPMLGIVGLGLLLNNLWSSQQHVLGISSNLSQSAFLSSTNEARAENSESGLTLSPQLEQAAQAKAEDMAKYNYWSHTSPSGKSPWDFINATGYSYQLAGENLAYGFNSAATIISAWMNSPEHRENILTSSYKNVGFGVYSTPNYQGHGPETIVVAEYAEPAAVASSISFSVANPSSINSSAKNVSPQATEISAQPVSRIQTITGGRAIWSAIVVSILLGICFGIMLLKYGLRLKRALTLGEAFIVHHPMIDTSIVLLGTICFILSRANGFIR